MLSVKNNITNSGFYIIRHSDTLPEERTILVSGIGRSGTTAAISCLYKGGLPQISSHLAQRTLDDWGIGTHFDNNDIGGLRREVVRRDQTSKVWGFKWHMVQTWSNKINLFRNPLLIVMYRDSVSISVRARRDDANYHNVQSLNKWMQDTALWNMQLTQAVTQEISCPTLLVSYEKLIGSPEKIVPVMLDFCGLPFSEEAIKAIQPSINAYTNSEPVVSPKWKAIE